MNPYRLQPPALISFSGGRTSAFMLRQILDAYGGTLPPDVYVTFANTGKERLETLDFVHECETRWNVAVAWLEYDRVQQEKEWRHVYRTVDYATASRRGEPFKTLIRAKGYLPNPLMRYCTVELKIRVMKKYMLDQGAEEWDMVLGLRADEPMRVHRAKLSCAKERWNNVTPMATAGHTLDDVMAFWRSHPFDLQLEQHEGNCDLCFLKGAAKIESILIDKPELNGWWADAEADVGATFRIDRPSYANQLKIVQEQRRFCYGEEFDVCNCTD